jgi:hypothetical protein
MAGLLQVCSHGFQCASMVAESHAHPLPVGFLCQVYVPKNMNKSAPVAWHSQGITSRACPTLIQTVANCVSDKHAVVSQHSACDNSMCENGGRRWGLRTAVRPGVTASACAYIYSRDQRICHLDAEHAMHMNHSMQGGHDPMSFEACSMPLANECFCSQARGLQCVRPHAESCTTTPVVSGLEEHLTPCAATK